jgi:hypothetical protein
MNAGQILVITCGMWGAILFWPKLGRHVSLGLMRHSQGMRAFYVFLQMGLREYWTIVRGAEASWSGHPDFKMDTYRKEVTRTS